MKLDVTCMRYMSKDEFRVLTAVEVRSLVACFFGWVWCVGLAGAGIESTRLQSPTPLQTHTHTYKQQMGMKNHDVVPVELITAIAKLRCVFTSLSPIYCFQ